MVSQVKDEAWIEWITTLMEQSAQPKVSERRLPASAFHCLLDDQPDHLLPRRYAAEVKAPVRGLVLNPGCVFLQAGAVPTGVDTNLVANFALPGIVAWVPDPLIRSWAPFWLREQFSSLLCRLRGGDQEPEGLSPYTRATLAYAGILILPDEVDRQQQRWAGIVERAMPLAAKGYAPVGKLIHPFHIAALRRYYRYLVRTGQVRLGDDQSERRYVAHNESVARFFHHQLTRAVSDLVGEAVKPSYCYFSSYLGGAELEKHLDRPQCEFSLTLQLDYAPEPLHETPWPLYLETPEGTVTVYQGLGDALFYRGHQIPHYRFPLRQGHVSSHIFFHYVREGFEGPLR
jgi:hypothetical protein